jgi:hypothetical protein
MGQSFPMRRFNPLVKKTVLQSIDASKLPMAAAKGHADRVPPDGTCASHEPRQASAAARHGFLHAALQVLTHVAAQAAQPTSQSFLAFSSSKNPHVASPIASASEHPARQAAREHAGKGFADENHCCHM